MRKKLLVILSALMMLAPATVNAKEFVEEPKEPTYINMGEFKITYYCGCRSCSEGYGKTTATTHRTGLLAEEGRTVAVDPSVINLGDKLKIGDTELGLENAHDYVAEDTGGGVRGEHIDVYVENHSDIPEHGVEHLNVWIVR